MLTSREMVLDLMRLFLLAFVAAVVKAQDTPSNLKSQGWTHIGCHYDPSYSRCFRLTETSSPTACAAKCKSSAAFALLGKNCCCDAKLSHAVSKGKAPRESACNAKCVGNTYVFCGGIFNGRKVLNVYGKVESTTQSQNFNNHGCYNDPKYSRCHRLTRNNSPTECAKRCKDKEAFGLLGKNCCCDEKFQHAISKGKVANSACNVKCTGDSSAICGGNLNGQFVINIYGKAAVTGASPSSGLGFTPRGCFYDPKYARCFRLDTTNSPKNCAEKCSSSQAFGLLGKNCCCDKSISHALGGGIVAGSACAAKCAGDNSKKCGGQFSGRFVLNVYAKDGLQSPEVRTTTTTTTPAPTTTTTTTPAPIITTPPVTLENWLHHGCYNDPKFARCFQMPTTNSPINCAKRCQNSPVFALLGRNCCCDKTIVHTTAKGKTEESFCSAKCSGDKSETCGGRNNGEFVLNVYAKKGIQLPATTPAPTTATTSTTTTTTPKPFIPPPVKQPKCGVTKIKPKPVRRLQNKRQSRIVGGVNVRPYSFPWMVSIFYFGQHQCGGTLIGPRHVLTAAHCFKDDNDPSRYEVQLGTFSTLLTEPGEVHVKVQRIIMHDEYDVPSFLFDIALMVLVEPVTFTNHIAPVCLPQRRVETDRLCTVIGWGKTKAKNSRGTALLRQVGVPTMAQDKCNSTDFYNGRIKHPMLCAGYDEGIMDSCEGDSGGPLMCDEGADGWVQYGIVSFGESCAKEKKPGVYTDVAELRRWITERSAIS